MSRRTSITSSHSFMTRLSQMKLTQKRRSGVLKLLDTYEETHVNQPGRNISLDIFMRYFFL